MTTFTLEDWATIIKWLETQPSVFAELEEVDDVGGELVIYTGLTRDSDGSLQWQKCHCCHDSNGNIVEAGA
jgi:hypothetical protein